MCGTLVCTVHHSIAFVTVCKEAASQERAHCLFSITLLLIDLPLFSWPPFIILDRPLEKTRKRVRKIIKAEAESLCEADSHE